MDIEAFHIGFITCKHCNTAISVSVVYARGDGRCPYCHKDTVTKPWPRDRFDSIATIRNLCSTKGLSAVARLTRVDYKILSELLKGKSVSARTWKKIEEWLNSEYKRV